MPLRNKTGFNPPRRASLSRLHRSQEEISTQKIPGAIFRLRFAPFVNRPPNFERSILALLRCSALLDCLNHVKLLEGMQDLEEPIGRSIVHFQLSNQVRVKGRPSVDAQTVGRRQQWNAAPSHMTWFYNLITIPTNKKKT